MIRTLKIERLKPFGRWLPTDVYLWAKAVLLALIAIQLARLLWVLVTPVGPFGPWEPAAARVLPPEARAAIFAKVDPFFRGAPARPAAAAAPAVDLKLFGVRMSRGALPGSAILGSADGEQKSYVIGEEVADGVTLAAVHFDYIVVKRGDAEQRIYMDGAEPTGSASAAPGAPVASPARGFDIQPRMQGGRVTGATVNPGGNSALYAAAGFRPGDVVVAVNGARIASMIDIQQLQSSIAPGARLMLTVERGAQSVPIAFNVPGNP